MNSNCWTFSWKPTRASAALPIECEEAVRSFHLDEFGVKKPFSYRAKDYTVELRCGSYQGAGFHIIATRLDDGVEIPITAHYIDLPKDLVCKVTFAKKRAYKKKGSSSVSESDESTEDSAMESD